MDDARLMHILETLQDVLSVGEEFGVVSDWCMLLRKVG